MAAGHEPLLTSLLALQLGAPTAWQPCPPRLPSLSPQHGYELPKLATTTWGEKPTVGYGGAVVGVFEVKGSGWVLVVVNKSPRNHIRDTKDGGIRSLAHFKTQWRSQAPFSVFLLDPSSVNFAHWERPRVEFSGG